MSAQSVFLLTEKWVHENIIILSETDPSETNRRPICLIGDSLETSTCFIRDPLETYMFHRRPIVDWHAPSETHWRPTWFTGDRHAWLETHRIPWHVSLETHWKLTFLVGDRHAWSETEMHYQSPYIIPI